MFEVEIYKPKILEINRLDPKKPIVALTFDDGPSKYTTHILNLLEQYEGRVTFFVEGSKIAGNETKITRAHNMRNEIICHSWNHLDMTKLSGRAIKKQLIDTITAIARITQGASLMFRPPYGYLNKKVEKIAQKLGLAIILWSVDPRDWESKNAKSVYDHIMKNVKDGDIILCHDVHKSTAIAMTRLIPVLIEQGYQLVTVSELLHHKYGEIEPGRVYES